MVISPEHPYLEKYHDRIENMEEVHAYQKCAEKKSDFERTEMNKDKTGVELKGFRAINPATGQSIPVWVSDYVLMGYGTGAIMSFFLWLRCTGLEHSGHHVGHHHGGSAAQLVSELREFGQQLPAGDPEMFGELMDSGTRGQLGGSGFLIGFGHVRLLRAHWRQLQRGSPRLSRLKVNRKSIGASAVEFIVAVFSPGRPLGSTGGA